MNHWILIIITTSSALFFFVLSLLLILKGKREYKIKLEGTRALLKKAQELKLLRQEKLKQINENNIFNETISEKVWLAELEFYQQLVETLCLPTENAINRLASDVNKLVLPYYNLVEELAKLAPQNDIDTDEEHSEIDPTQMIGDKATLAEKMNLLIQKLDEKNNDKANFKNIADEVANAFITKLSEEKDEKLMFFQQLIEKLLNDLTTLVEEEYASPENMDLAQYQALSEATINKIAQSLKQQTSHEENTEQLQTIIEQLRNEKVQYLKKYKRAMTHLLDVYKKYAKQNDLMLPNNAEVIEIEEFEKHITEA